ncbi:glycosyltransferase [Alcaligenaceae bacterium]|nr:glycosyltransferase [Alcaligenaceae bacterium]
MRSETSLKVSVIVPTYQRPDLLERCLDALGRQTLPHDAYEIIVCDDGPGEAARRVAAQAFAGRPLAPLVRYLEVRNSQGPAGARNMGWRSARAPIIAFTDDDTVPDPTWLEAGLAAMTPDVHAVTGRIVMPLPPAPSDIERDAARLSDAEFVTANCFIRKDTLDEVGGFDERFRIAWREDSDLHFNLLERGCTIVQAADALVVHPLRPTSFGAGIGMQKKIVYDVLLYCKHPRLYRERIRRRAPWFYLLVMLLLLGSVVCLAIGRLDWATISLSGWAMATLAFFAWRLAHSAATFRNAFELLLTSVCIPPLSIFWRMVGIRRYGAKFP